MGSQEKDHHEGFPTDEELLFPANPERLQTEIRRTISQLSRPDTVPVEEWYDDDVARIVQAYANPCTRHLIEELFYIRYPEISPTTDSLIYKARQYDRRVTDQYLQLARWYEYLERYKQTVKLNPEPHSNGDEGDKGAA